MIPADAITLSISRTEPACTVLGPGTRCVVWVQGCPLRCPGCVADSLLPFSGGHVVSVTELARQILAGPEIDGVTLSGGEPFAQAAGLLALVRELRSHRPELSVMSYSGFPLDWLRRRGSIEQLALLAELDILIDGPYRQDLHGSLRWRGSSNQQIRLLSDRHAELASEPDVSAGLQVAVNETGAFRWAGVPPVPNFRAQLTELLAARGLTVEEVTP